MSNFAPYRSFDFSKCLGDLLDGSTSMKESAASELCQLSFQVQESKRHILDFPGLVQALIRAMEIGTSDNLKESAAGVLCNLAVEAENRREIFFIPGLIQALVKAIYKDESTTMLKERAAGLLQMLSGEAQIIRPMFLVPALALVLIKAVKEGTSSTLKEFAAAALSNMALGVNARPMFLLPELVPVLIKAMLERRESTKLKETSARMFAMLAYRDENQRPMCLFPGLIPALMKAVNQGESTQLKEHAALALSNVAAKEENRRDFLLVPDLVQSWIKMLDRGESTRLKEFAADVLWKLAGPEENKRPMFLVPNLIPALIKAVVKGESCKLKEYATEVLSNLSVEKENFREMMSSPGLIKTMTEMLEKGKSTKLKEKSAEVLSNLAVDEENSREMFKFPGLIPALIKALNEGESTHLKEKAAGTLRHMAHKAENMRPMFSFPELVSSLIIAVDKGESLALKHYATGALYGISCAVQSDFLRSFPQLALTLKRDMKDSGIYFWPTLTWINVSGTHEKFEISEDMLKTIKEFVWVKSVQGEGGWKLQHGLLAFRLLSVVDPNRRKLFQMGLLPAILQATEMAIDRHEEEAAESGLTCLSLFAFDKDSQAWLQQQSERIIDMIAKVESDPTFGEAKKSGQGLRFDLKEEVHVPSNVPVQSSSQPTPISIMISYNWGSQDLALKIKEFLKSRNFSVWIDVDNMRGDIFDAMAEGVETSSHIIVIVSQKYKESANCRRECKYAMGNSKKIIPVLADPSYTGDGWLGLSITGLLYYNANQLGELVRNEIEGGGGGAPPDPPKMKETVWPHGEHAISEWLKGCREGDRIARVLIAEGLDEGEDMKDLTCKSEEQLKILIPALTVKNIKTLKKALEERQFLNG